jgi:hypothetical protein
MSCCVFLAGHAQGTKNHEPMEVGEAGSKRPSSGGNGGHVVKTAKTAPHVVSLHPLTWRSLGPSWRGGGGLPFARGCSTRPYARIHHSPPGPKPLRLNSIWALPRHFAVGRKILPRWISSSNRSQARALCQGVLGRTEDLPPGKSLPGGLWGLVPVRAVQ